LTDPVAYIFTDIDNSVGKWEKGPAAMKRAVRRHDVILEDAISRHGGKIHDRNGDGVFAYFDGGDALACALDLQRAFRRETWDEVGGLSIRIGVHAALEASPGEREKADVHRTARLVASAWGGQIVISALAAAQFRPPDGATLIDLGIVYLRGLEAPHHLFALTHDDLGKEEFPPLRGVVRQSPNLPAATTPIFGREQDIADILVFLRGGARQITIVGAGGMGKTRLALEIASAAASDQETHLALLTSGPCSSEDLATAIAAALRLPQRPNVPSGSLIVEYLRDREVLLVIDNADGLSDGRLIGACLAACPGVQILVTRREPLCSAGEIVFHLRGLPPPDSADQLQASPAGMLFAQSARAADPEFNLLEADFAVFCRICELVRGSPLAMYLTAQWISVLPLAEIAAKLERGVAFLSEVGGGRTLRDVFEGSWSLLTPVQRQALASLSIFPATFDREGANAVAEADTVILLQLERKSLVERRSSYRFALHPLVQEYAAERLAEQTDDFRQRLRARHSAHYLGQVGALYKTALGPDQKRVASQLRTELPNLRAAWDFAVGAPPSGLELCAEQTFYALVFAGMFAEGVELFSNPGETLQGLCLGLKANCLVHLGRYEEAEVAARGGLQVSQEHTIVAHCHQALGNIAHARGAWAEADAHYAQALELRGGDDIGLAYTVLSLAALKTRQGRFSEARAWLEQGLMVSRRQGFVIGLLVAHLCAADVAAGENRPAEAQKALERALALVDTIDAPQQSAATRVKLGRLMVRQGRRAEATELFEQALQQAAAIGDERETIRSACGLAAALGDPERAHVLLSDAFGRARRLASAPKLATVLVEIGKNHIVEGRRQRAAYVLAIAKALDQTSVTADLEYAIGLLGGEPLPDLAPEGAQAAIEDLAAEIAPTDFAAIRKSM
jgi:predicted ATPase/class 3 adenylate cyclase